jgi:hypothetical protein
MTLLSLNLRRIRYYTPITGKCCQNVGNTVRLSRKLTVEEDLRWKETYQCGEIRWAKSAYKGMNYMMNNLQGWRLRRWNKDKRPPLTWPFHWPKEWLFSVQSRSTPTLLNRSSTMEKGYTQENLEGDLMSKFVNRHPPIGHEDRI